MSAESMPGLFSLQGQTVFLTGAGRGLGAAAARGLAEAGAQVVLADIGDSVHAVAAALAGAGHTSLALRLDVREEAAFGAAFAAAAAIGYLASPAAGFITGATLGLNGGRLMR